MAGSAADGGEQRGRAWRGVPWMIAALLLLLPLLAMQVTDEVAWDGTDFAIIGALLLAACTALEGAARRTGSLAYRAAMGVAVATACLLVWMNLAVGIIGSEADPANRMYGGVLAIGILGAVMVRLEPRGMARVLIAVALAQAVVGLGAVIAGLGAGSANWPGAILGLTAGFTALWLLSAWLFRKVAQAQGAACGAS